MVSKEKLRSGRSVPASAVSRWYAPRPRTVASPPAPSCQVHGTVPPAIQRARAGAAVHAGAASGRSLRQVPLKFAFVHCSRRAPHFRFLFTKQLLLQTILQPTCANANANSKSGSHTSPFCRQPLCCICAASVFARTALAPLFGSYQSRAVLDTGSPLCLKDASAIRREPA